MNQQPVSINVLGLDITFRPGSDLDRARRAARLLEERYADQKARSRGAQSKDILLTFLALGLADELLQMKNGQELLEEKIGSLLAKIENSL